MERRQLIKGAGMLAAAATIGARPASAAETDTCGRVADPRNILMVHGASTGASSLTALADLLRANGHRVFVPCLSGVGERNHLLSREIDLTTHLNDVANIITYERLEDVVLVGHSYGGAVITCIADQKPGKVRSLIYLDGILPEDGKAIADTGNNLAVMQERWDSGEAGTAPPPEVPGLTPHPLAAFLEPVKLSGAWQTVANRTYVRATLSETPPLASTLARVDSEDGWNKVGIAGTHIFPINMPAETAAIIEDAA